MIDKDDLLFRVLEEIERGSKEGPYFDIFWHAVGWCENLGLVKWTKHDSHPLLTDRGRAWLEVARSGKP